MSFVIKEFKKYKLFLMSGGGNELGSILIKLGKAKATLRFAKGRLAKNSSKKSGDIENYRINLPAEQWANYVDLLRNEKPLFFYFNNKTKQSYITTSDEPVGEGE